MTAVAVEGLLKKYDDHEAVSGADFSVDEGEVFALLGPNGAGRTTTMEILEAVVQSIRFPPVFISGNYFPIHSEVLNAATRPGVPPAAPRREGPPPSGEAPRRMRRTRKCNEAPHPEGNSPHVFQHRRTRDRVRPRRPHRPGR